MLKKGCLSFGRTFKMLYICVKYVRKFAKKYDFTLFRFHTLSSSPRHSKNRCKVGLQACVMSHRNLTRGGWTEREIEERNSVIYIEGKEKQCKIRTPVFVCVWRHQRCPIPQVVEDIIVSRLWIEKRGHKSSDRLRYLHSTKCYETTKRLTDVRLAARQTRHQAKTVNATLMQIDHI